MMNYSAFPLFLYSSTLTELFYKFFLYPFHLFLTLACSHTFRASPLHPQDKELLSPVWDLQLQIFHQAQLRADIVLREGSLTHQ